MKKVCDAMKKSVLFWDIKEEDLERVISCFDVKLSRYDRDEFVIHQGERAKGVGLVVSGQLHSRPTLEKLPSVNWVGKTETVREAILLPL